MLLAFASAAVACTCAGVSPCEAYGNASVVFVGTVTKTTIESAASQLPSNAISTTLTNGRAVAVLKVEQTFGQTISETVQIYGQGTTCDLPFKTGERYLVYAYQDATTKTLSTNICSGTALVTEAEDHLAYLIGARNASGGTVSGEIKRETILRTGPIIGAEITLVNGDRTFRGKTNAAGKFTVGGLPEGKYKLQTSPRTNYSSLNVMAEGPLSEWEIEVPGRGCVNAWFIARPDGEIAGSITDEAGIVPGDIEPILIPVDATPDGYEYAKLKDFGNFRFSFVPPGRYYLGINLRGGPSLSSPYPEVYYPGVSERARAKIITLVEGQKITNLRFPRPLRLGERMLEGIAVWPNGKPYTQECGIEIANPRTGYREGNCVSPDAQGRFKIKAIEGQTYDLSATVRRPGSFSLIQSKPIRVTVGKDKRPLRLVVTMP